MDWLFDLDLDVENFEYRGDGIYSYCTKIILLTIIHYPVWSVITTVAIIVLVFILRWHSDRQPYIPPPDFKDSKRLAKFKNSIWYGRISPNKARRLSKGMYYENEIEEIISECTKYPSYWSKNTPKEKDK